jgi:hypothetical protein
MVRTAMRSPVSVPPFFWALGDGGELPGRPDDALGHDGETFLVRLGDGSVRSLDPRGVLPDRHVNASAGQFLGSLETFAAEWSARKNLPDKAAAAQAGRLRHALEAIGTGAMRAAGNWWSVIVGQLEDGLI